MQGRSLTVVEVQLEAAVTGGSGGVEKEKSRPLRAAALRACWAAASRPLRSSLRRAGATGASVRVHGRHATNPCVHAVCGGVGRSDGLRVCGCVWAVRVQG